MLTISILFVLAAFVAAVMAAMGKCPLWVSVILLCVLELVRVLPLR